MKSILDYVYEESSKIDKNNQQKIYDSINDAISKIDTIDGGVNMTDFVVSLIDEIYKSRKENLNFGMGIGFKGEEISTINKSKIEKFMDDNVKIDSTVSKQYEISHESNFEIKRKEIIDKPISERNSTYSNLRIFDIFAVLKGIKGEIWQIETAKLFIAALKTKVIFYQPMQLGYIQSLFLINIILIIIVLFTNKKCTKKSLIILLILH